ncbi:MAG: FAD-dependent oxidoreductase [Nitrososphaeraceae archaeon]
MSLASDSMHILIAGGGYAGIQTALGLEQLFKENYPKIQLIDKNIYHTLLPSLPEILSKRGFSIIYYKDIIQGKKINFIQAHIVDVDLDKKLVFTTNPSYRLGYDFLVLSLGSRPFLPNIPGLREHSFQFNSVENAKKIAERLSSKDMIDATENINIIIGGGGATGVEVAGEIASLIKKKNQQYNNIKVILISPDLLVGFPTHTKNWVRAYLEALNVELLLGNEYYITEVKSDLVCLRNGRTIRTTMLIWAGGVTALPLPQQVGLKTGYNGRVVVNKFLQAEGRKNVFILGDAALILNNKGYPVPTTAYFAEQHGKIAAQNIYSMIKDQGRTMKEYKVESHWLDNFAISIGSDLAVSRIRGLDLYGYSASKVKKLIKMKYLKDLKK